MGRPGDNHHPTLRRFMPEYFGIAKVLFMNVEHRIAREFRPGATAIIAPGDLLVLKWFARVMAGVDGDEWRLAVPAKATAVFPIHYSAARKDHHAILFGQGDG